MDQHEVPLAVEVDPATNLTDLVVDVARTRPGFPLFRRPDGAGWRDVSAATFLAEVTALARGLVAAGVQPGDRVGLMSRTRYEWTLTDFAVWFAGAVTVPVYETSSAEQAQWVLSDSGAVACVVESASHAGLLAGAAGGLPLLRDVWTIDAGDLDAVAAAGTGVPDEELERRRSRAGLADLATIVYTSGTTGRPKGCRLTHGNFVVHARNAIHRVPDVFAGGDASTLLFLPLAHVLARYVQVVCVASPMTSGHVPDTKELVRDLASFRPSFVLAVPRVFEKVFAGAQERADAAGRGRVFARAVEVAVRWSRAVGPDRRGRPGWRLRAEHALFDRLVYARLRGALGGRARYAVSGGAPLGERLGHFFRGAGTTVLEGWGLTETTAASTVNPTERVRVGTVGPPLPGVAVRIAEDGEVLVAGPHVCDGYWDGTPRGPEGADGADGADGSARSDGAARSGDGAFDGRWFRTGDLGSLDDDGHLTITGRKKEIIVTAAGKNVAPAVLEDRLRAHPLVGHALVVGDRRPFVAALLTLDPEVLPGWLHRHGRPDLPLARAATDPVVRAELQRAVDAANEAVSRAESVRAFAVLGTDLTEADGYVTPSMKLKRAVVLAHFTEEVERIYAR